MSKKKLLAGLLVLILAASGAAGCVGVSQPVPAIGTVTAVAKTQTELMSVSAPSCDYGGELRSIQAIDGLTVKFTLCFPDPAFLQKVASPALGIQSSRYLEATKGTGDFVSHPIGTGPWKFERWDRGNELVFTRNKNYWGTPVQEGTLIFRWSAEASQRLNELLAGAVDGIDNVGPGDFQTVKNNPHLALYVRPSINVAYLGISAAFKPFDDVRVRQAVAYALDRRRIVDNFYPPGSIVATQFLPPALFGHTPEVEPLPYDPKKAEALLDEAGLARGADGKRFATSLAYRDVVRAYLPQPGVVAQDIQAQLAQVGIDVKLQVMESGAFISAVFAGNQLPMHLIGGTVDYPDGSNLLSFIFSGSSPAVFGAKFGDISDPVDETNRRADPKERLQFFRKVNLALRDLAPVVPFAHGGSAAAYQARIEGAHVSPMAEYDRFAVMQDPNGDNIVWMQNAEPVGLYCALNTDGESLRACAQVHEGLMAFATGSSEVVPGLAESYQVNNDSTEWTFKLRPGVTFHDGSTLHANDAVLSYVVQWDVHHPFHPGEGNVPTFSAFFGQLLNASKK